MAHSAYPELGDSAIHKLLDALAAIRAFQLPVDDLLGPSTLNIGTISGGRAPNVIADEARAEIFIRLVGDSAATKEALAAAPWQARVELREVLEIPALRLTAVDGIATTVVAFTTDIPAFGGRMGRAVSVRAGHHPRGAHARRARAQTGSYSKPSKSIRTNGQAIMQTLSKSK